MRCKACNKILEDNELTKKDIHGEFIDLCSFCLSVSIKGELEDDYDVNFSEDMLLTNDENYDTLY